MADNTLDRLLDEVETARQAYVDTFRVHGVAAVDLGGLEHAAAKAEEARALARRADDAAAADRALLALGTVLRMARDWSSAERALSEVADTAAPDVVFEANLQLARVHMYRAQPDLGAARRALAAAQARLGDTGTAKQRFDMVSFAAELDIYAGNLEAAVALVTTAFDAADAARDPGLAVFAYLTQADALQKMAERCDYVDTFGECRRAAAAAARAYDAAGAEAVALGWRGLVEQIDELRSELAMRSQMIDMKESGFAQLQGVFNPVEASNVLVNEEFIPPAGDSDGLLASLVGQVVQTPDTARNAYLLGKQAELAGDPERARVLFRQGVALLERERGSVFDPQRTGSVIENRVEIYRDAILHDLHAGDHAAAFEMLERARARGLAELMALPADAKMADFLSALTLAEANVSLAQTQLVEAILEGKPTSEVEAAARTFAERRGARERLIADNAATAAGLRSSPWHPPPLAEIEAYTRRHDVTVLQYLTTDANLVTWAIGPHKSAVRTIFLPRRELEVKIEAIRQSVTGNGGNPTPAKPFPEDVARQLYLYLIAPMAPWISGDRLVIIPQGSLGELPFEALVNPETGQSLVAERAVAYAPNAAFLIENQPLGRAAPRSMLIVSDEQVDATTERIVPLVADRLELTVLNELAPDAVPAHIAAADLVHVATHGRLRSEEPLLSWVRIPHATSRLGGWPLTAAHMVALPFDAVRLAVLGACDTAMAERTVANEMFGIPWALMVAGAHELVVSRWRVNNQETGSWMAAFYGDIRAGADVAAAARTASLALAADLRTAHPYYWAAFQPFVR